MQRLAVRPRPVTAPVRTQRPAADAAPSTAPVDTAGPVVREQVERYVVPGVATLYVHKGELCNG